MSMGWECPKCHKVYAPTVKECEGCNWVFTQYPPTIIPKQWPQDGSGDFPIPQWPNTSEPCLMDGFMKQNPNHSGPILLSCPCPKCSPRC